MNAIDGLTLALVIVSMLGLFFFVFAFGRIGDNKRIIDYVDKQVARTDSRVFTNQERIAKLYDADLHNFERPKVDLHEDDHNRQINGIVERLYEVEKKLEKIKEVKK